MFLQLTLVLLALPGSLQQDDDCTERAMRLHGEEEYAGHAEVCWKTNSSVQEEYAWRWYVCTTVCLDEVRAECNKLNSNSTIAGILNCGAKCIDQGTGARVQLKCSTREESPCRRSTIWISPCTATTTQDVRLVSATPPSGPTPPSEPTPHSGLGKPNTTSASEINKAMGGVMGAVIIALVIVLVGMNLGWWFYHRRSGKQRINQRENATANEVKKERNHNYDILTYDMTSYKENQTFSLSNHTTPTDHTPVTSLGSAGTSTEHSHYNQKSEGRDKIHAYHTLEMKNTDNIPLVSTAGGEEQDRDITSIDTEL